MITLDIQVNSLPGRPVVLIDAATVIVNVRAARRTAKNMQIVDGQVAGKVLFLFLVHADHLQPGHGIQLLQIAAEGGLGRIVGQIVLQQFAFQLLEKGRFIVT